MFLEQNDLVMTFVIFIHFVLTFVWKWHALLMCSVYGTEETTSVKKIFIILFGIKEKQLHCENSLYRVYYCYGNYHVMQPFNNY